MKSVIAFGLALLGLSQSLPSSTTNKEALELRDLVTVDGIFKHLEKFYEIGIPNSRSVRNGYNASAEYVISQLAPYCQTYTQSFVVPVHQQLRNPTLSLISPYTTTFQHGVDFQGMRYGGDGFHNFTASVSHVISGCKDQDYVGFTRGHIALIQEGGGVCELVDKALMAEKFGASAILFYNQQTRTSLLTSRVRYVEWKFGDALVRKPVLAISNLLGKLLLETPYPKVSLMADMLLTQDYTFNIFCDTKSGDKNNIVMAGAHLDSVPEGPGINDNGSGSATLLEIALQFFKNGLTNTNAIRFAWWGAEEIGLLGSRHYVRELKKTPEQLEKIALYMNFDMLGSPNFTPQIHDGYKTSSAIPPEVKKASSRVQNVFEQYFEEESLPYQLIDMVAGSDFVPFIEAGIPSSGMATGASSLKSDEERTTFGGLANAEYDPCYHLPCDTVLNISKEGIRQVSESTASTIQKLANIQNLRGYLYG